MSPDTRGVGHGNHPSWHWSVMPPVWWRHHLGRRGGFLALFGGVWILIGVGYLATGLALAQYFPVLGEQPWKSVAAALWIVCGIIALSRAPRIAGNDGLGFVALQIPAAIWTVLQFGSWALSWDWGWWDDDRVGNPLGWLGVAVYGVMVGVVVLVAGWAEPLDDA